MEVKHKLKLYTELFYHNYSIRISDLRTMTDLDRNVAVVKILLRYKYIEWLNPDLHSQFQSITPLIDNIKLKQYDISVENDIDVLRISYTTDNINSIFLAPITDKTLVYLDFNIDECYRLIRLNMANKQGRYYNFNRYVEQGGILPNLQLDNMEIMQQHIMEILTIKDSHPDTFTFLYNRIKPYLFGYDELFNGASINNWYNLSNNDGNQSEKKYFNLKKKDNQLLIRINNILSEFNAVMINTSRGTDSLFYNFQMVNRIRYLYERYYYRPFAYEYFSLLCSEIENITKTRNINSQLVELSKIIKLQISTFYISADFCMLLYDIWHPEHDKQLLYLAPEINNFLIINKGIISGMQNMDIAKNCNGLLEYHLNDYVKNNFITDLLTCYKIIMFMYANQMTIYQKKNIDISNTELDLLYQMLKIQPYDDLLNQKQNDTVMSKYQNILRYNINFTTLVDIITTKIELYSNYNPLDYL
jgi:hypothetical protein